MAGTAEPRTRPSVVSPQDANQRILERKGLAAKAEIPNPIKETPKSEPPPTTPPAKVETPPTPPAFDVAGYNKAFGKEHKTTDEIKSLYDYEDKYKKRDTEFTELNKKYSELTLKSKESPFADELAAKVNQMRKNGATTQQIKSFIEVTDLDLAKLDPKSKFVKTYELRDGLTEVKAQKLFNSQYKIDRSQYNYDKATLDETEIAQKEVEIADKIEIENIRLEQDARGIDSFLSEYKTKVSTVENQQEAFNKQWKQVEPAVKEVASAFANTYAGLKTSFKVDKDEEPIDFAYQVSDEFRNAIPQILEDYWISELAQGRPVSLNQDGLKQAKNYVDRVLKAEMFDKYAMDSGVHLYSKAVEKMANKFSNGGKKQIDQPPVDTGKPKDSRDAYKEQTLKPRRQGISAGA